MGLGRRAAPRVLSVGPLLLARPALRRVRGHRRLGEGHSFGDRRRRPARYRRGTDRRRRRAARRGWIRPARDRGLHRGDRRRGRLGLRRRPLPHGRRPRGARGPARCCDRDDRSRRGRSGVRRRARRRDAERRRRDPPVRGGRAAALVYAVCALVGHRFHRRGLVPRGCLGEVGRPPPAVLPRPRRDACGAGRVAARGLRPRSSAIREDCSTRRPRAGTAATCTST